ncbi:MAG: hypothetical protein ACKO14_11380 [Armatimonadota bacterium]
MTHLLDQITHSAALTSLVIVVAIVLFIIEVFSPHTLGLVGILGMMVISVLLYAYQVSGIGYWFGPLIAIVGVALVMLEALGVHAHGFLIMPGAAAIGIGMFYALGAGINAGISSTVGIAATFCAMYYAFKVLPLSTFWRKSGSGNTLRLPERPVTAGVEPGTQCIATSDLRPCGMVKIGERRYRARLTAGFARTGTIVVVSEVRNQELLVTVEEQ